jgi:hypothetical protein
MLINETGTKQVSVGVTLYLYSGNNQFESCPGYQPTGFPISPHMNVAIVN